MNPTCVGKVGPPRLTRAAARRVDHECVGRVTAIIAEETEEEVGDTPSEEEEPETYGEHGELLHAHHPTPEGPHPHLNLKG